MNKEEIAALRALEKKATPGPWQTRFFYRMFVRVREAPGDLAFNTDDSNDWADCECIAAARNALPRLLDALEAKDEQIAWERNKAALMLDERERFAREKLAAEARADRLAKALRTVLADIADYERVNNLAPSPGRVDCWQSVAWAKEALAREPKP